MKTRLENKRKTLLGRRIAIALWATAIGALFLLGGQLAWAQEGEEHRIGVRGFLDEDGDGFNDLIPDFDGDGVPNPIDPDWQGRRQGADSAGMHRGMYGRDDSTGSMRGTMMGPGYMFMERHGEHGMYGPGDSTMHGGMWPDSGGHRGGGGHGGMWPDSGGMGGGGMDGGGMGGPGPNRTTDPSRDNREIRNTPENNGEADGLAVPLRDVFEGGGKNQ